MLMKKIAYQLKENRADCAITSKDKMNEEYRIVIL